MSIFGKIAIGIGIAVAGGIIIKKVVTKKYTTINKNVVDENGNPVKEETTIWKKIKEAATKKAIKIVGWVVDHMKEVQAISEIIGLVGGSVSLVYSIYQFKHKGKLEKKIDNLERVIINNSNKDHLSFWMKGYSNGASDKFVTAFNETKACSKDGTPLKFIDKAGNLIGQFKVEEVKA